MIKFFYNKFENVFVHFKLIELMFQFKSNGQLNNLNKNRTRDYGWKNKVLSLKILDRDKNKNKTIIKKWTMRCFSIKYPKILPPN